jgi:hypothetical protein
MFPLPVFHYFAIGAFIISVVVLYRFDHKPLRWFIPFLFVMVSTELAGRYIRKVLHEPNVWLYNISIPIEYLFYGFIIGSLCVNIRFKKIIFYLTFCLGIWAVVNLLFIQGFNDLNTITLKAGCSVMLVLSGMGLIDLFRNDESTSLLVIPLFWICAGVLFFNTGEFLHNFIFDILLKDYWINALKAFGVIQSKLIYVLYSCISIAILCTKKQGKT